jgi:bifunctional UDP-N-acetylglucosamine pyrophosphorylase/glucosamine-1-phosphate N-acetyltransferase
MERLAAVILAGGKSKRFKTALPKVLHNLCGKPMIGWVMDLVADLGVEKRVIVIGPSSTAIKDSYGGAALYAYQAEPLGTGHALMQTENILADYQGTILVIYGDTPLWRLRTLRGLIETHHSAGADATVATAILDSPPAYGRIIRDRNGRITKIVEEKDCTAEEKKIREINVGLYCFSSRVLYRELAKVSNDNAQKEYYLTDVIGIAAADGLKVESYPVEDPSESLGINDRKQLAEAARVMNNRTLDRLMLEEGVAVMDPASTFIHPSVKIGQDSIIYPFTIIEGKTTIGPRCHIGPYARIIDSVIGSDVRIPASSIVGSTIGDGKQVEPYTILQGRRM